jgi:hypothetical protein
MCILKWPMADALHIVCPHCDAINRVPRERLREGDKCCSYHRPLFEKHPAVLNSAARFDKHAQRSDISLLVYFLGKLVRSVQDDDADLRTGGNPARA